MFFRIAALTAVLLAVTNPALAHMGDHSHYRLAEMAEHLLEWDHLLFLGLAGLIGFMAFRAGRHFEARRVRSDRDGNWKR